jgi:hypothetical protein
MFCYTRQRPLDPQGGDDNNSKHWQLVILRSSNWQKNLNQGLVQQQKVLKEVLNNPMLPVLVEQWPAGSISQLIDQVGVENSNALIAHASSEQIRQVLDIQLWTPEPGHATNSSVSRYRGSDILHP